MLSLTVLWLAPVFPGSPGMPPKTVARAGSRSPSQILSALRGSHFYYFVTPANGYAIEIRKRAERRLGQMMAEII